MIKVSPVEATGNAEILYDDETVQGNYVGIRLNDDEGLKLMAMLVDFYEGKGLHPMELLNAAVKAQGQTGFLKRLFSLFKGV